MPPRYVFGRDNEVAIAALPSEQRAVWHVLWSDLVNLLDSAKAKPAASARSTYRFDK